jgi:hypothetical protein
MKGIEHVLDSGFILWVRVAVESVMLETSACVLQKHKFGSCTR